MRCNDPKCGCQPAPKRTSRKLTLFLHGAKPEQKCALHQPGAELDVVLDLVGNVLILRETIEDPERIKTAWTLSVHIDCSKMHLINLKGLKDGSLQLSLQMRRSACFPKGNKMLIKEKFHGFAPLHLGSRLYNDFYSCGWSQQRIELFLPAERISGWKTVALILRTFKEISAEQWCHLANIIKPPSVSLLDWRGLSEGLRAMAIKKPKDTVKEKKACIASKEGRVKSMHRDSMALGEHQLGKLPVLVSTVSC
ncbi:uncharacterized protein KD926_000031 [Aspergillus affinis]|uniref:uncharacterized protein n=1 Tax=Aspergillus affinis TaxID=1070780 RepID=UPI0022FEBC7A|nr:uncharacterized protein KD926_000031 [Aspergillus affinis]KAI9037768.1 hypothetical protein KD926_000031 [Aspergillus affinis]